ncbi:biotin transporter BioY [Anoxynatronum sibiricum]|uniref:Biotin transporter n=1 Tax=Anoxynatronum sibiricum TaxID=210623 RepID=A0ABU9VXA2_9CLOT
MTSKMTIHDYTRIALMAALISISSYIAVPLPFSPVPVTAQTLAIMLCGMLLTVRQSFYTLSVYLLLGTIGLPIFAGGGSGLGIIMGPTGGFLFGFLLAAVFISLTKGDQPSLWRYGLVNAIGSLVVVNLAGVPWLAWATGMDLPQAFAVGFMPFLPGAIIKLVIATLLAWKLVPQLRWLPASQSSH